MRKETQPENAVKRDAIKQLEASGWFVWKTEQSFIRGRTFKGTKGAPDICAIKNGKFLALECKTEIGKQSKDQKKFQEFIELFGGKYLVYRGGSLISNLFE